MARGPRGSPTDNFQKVFRSMGYVKTNYPLLSLRNRGVPEAGDSAETGTVQIFHTFNSNHPLAKPTRNKHATCFAR